MVTRWIRGRLRARWNRYARTGDPRHLKGDQVHAMMCHLVVAGEDEADSRLVSSVLAARGAHLVTPGERLVHAMQLSEITLLRLGVPPEEVPEHLEESLRQLTRGGREEPEPAATRFEDREQPAHAAASERDRFLDDLAVEVAEGPGRRASAWSSRPSRPAVPARAGAAVAVRGARRASRPGAGGRPRPGGGRDGDGRSGAGAGAHGAGAGHADALPALRRPGRHRRVRTPGPRGARVG